MFIYVDVYYVLLLCFVVVLFVVVFFKFIMLNVLLLDVYWGLGIIIMKKLFVVLVVSVFVVGCVV